MTVCDVLKLLKKDGWQQVTTRGSHRQLKHPSKPGRGQDDQGVTAENAGEYPEAGRAEGGRVMKYAVLIEKGPNSYGAYVPDLPGCVAVGDTAKEALQLIQEAIDLHIQGMREDGLPVPDPTTECIYMETQTA